MRIYLTQPSPNWVDNTLRNIKCYKVTIEAAAESEPPKHSFEVFRKKIKDNLDSLSATEGNKMSTV
jgi:hypothetical protein